VSQPAAKLIGPLGASESGLETDGAGPAALLDVEALIGSFPGPAAVTDQRGRCLATNAIGTVFAEVLAVSEGVELAAYVADCAAIGRSAQQKISLHTGIEARTFDLTIIPVTLGDPNRHGSVHKNEPGAVLLAHDVSHEQTLSSALVASRQLFRDLVECSADFAWETDVQGRFSYVSPNGVLGFTGSELAGRDPVDVFSIAGHQAVAFTSDHRLDDAEIWVTDKEGRAACLQVSALPVLKDGAWAGCRGVCHDVTEARQYETALAQAYEREHVIAEIVDAMRVEGRSTDMLQTAVQRTGKTLKANLCWITRVMSDRTLYCAAMWPPDGTETPTAAVDQIDAVLEGWCEDQGGEAIEVRHDGHSVLIGPCRIGQQLNGAICLVRPLEGAPWSETDKALLEGVARQLGIALTQVGHREELERLSRTDELTGLLNRRAFEPIVERQLAQAYRHDHQCALLYLDLDNFKQVNDRLGHHAGDALLTLFADTLTETSRLGDRVCRLGGDEFALWLDETDEAGAVVKAERIIGDLAAAWQALYPDGPAVGVSVGIAMTESGVRETFHQFMSRADQAMYAAKKTGKMRWTLAAPPELQSDEPHVDERGVDAC
jgi:diguanylate cyclase (GGDEF)-like protein/PAS domain S-box-containing protein